MIWSNNWWSSIKARIVGISPADKKAWVPLQFSLATDWKQENRVHDEEIVTVIWWAFKDLTFSEYEGEYGVRKSFNLTMVDQENWDIILGCGINNLGLNILNSILSITDGSDIKLSLYTKEGSDGKMYPNVALNTSLENSGPDNLLGWSMPYEEQKTFHDVTPAKKKWGKDEVDKERLFDEFKKRWEERDWSEVKAEPTPESDELPF